MNKLSSTLNSKALPAALFTVFIDAVGVGILIPIYTLLVSPGPQRVIPASWSLSSGFIMVGWLTGVYSLMTFLAAPILGQLSDKYGRKIVLAASLFGTSIGYALFAVGIITKNLPLLFLGRIIDGLTGGNIAVARAIVADVSTPKNRTRNFGLIGAMFGLGFVLGPYLGGKLAFAHIPFINLFGLHLLNTPSWFNAATPFWFAAILAFINTGLAMFVLPETIKEFIHSKLNINQSFINIRKAFTFPGIRNIMPVTFLWSGGFAFFTTFFGFNLIARIPGFKPGDVADFFSFIGICIVLVQVVITPILAKRFKNYQIVRVSLFGMSLAILTLLIPHTKAAVYSIGWIIPLFVGLNMANMIALVSSVAGPKIQGEVMGINSSVEALAQGIPAVLSGYIASISVGLPIFVASITVAIAGILFWVLIKPKMLHAPSAAALADAH
jgi:DHA1 family tetracycline resistance protein-like MFS transporter